MCWLDALLQDASIIDKIDNHTASNNIRFIGFSQLGTAERDLRVGLCMKGKMRHVLMIWGYIAQITNETGEVGTALSFNNVMNPCVGDQRNL